MEEGKGNKQGVIIHISPDFGTLCHRSTVHVQHFQKWCITAQHSIITHHTSSHNTEKACSTLHDVTLTWPEVRSCAGTPFSLEGVRLNAAAPPK